MYAVHMPVNHTESARPALRCNGRKQPPHPPAPPLPRAYSALLCLALAGINASAVDRSDKAEFARAMIRLNRAASRYVREMKRGPFGG